LSEGHDIRYPLSLEPLVVLTRVPLRDDTWVFEDADLGQFGELDGLEWQRGSALHSWFDVGSGEAGGVDGGTATALLLLLLLFMMVVVMVRCCCGLWAAFAAGLVDV